MKSSVKRASTVLFCYSVHIFNLLSSIILFRLFTIPVGCNQRKNYIKGDAESRISFLVYAWSPYHSFFCVTEFKLF